MGYLHVIYLSTHGVHTWRLEVCLSVCVCYSTSRLTVEAKDHSDCLSASRLTVEAKDHSDCLLADEG